MRVGLATKGEKSAISQGFMWCAHNGHARGRVLQRNMKADIVLKNTT